MPAQRSDDDDWIANGVGLLVFLLFFGVFILIGKGVQALRAGGTGHGQRQAVGWLLMGWLLSLAIGILIGTADPGSGTAVGMIVAVCWSVGVVIASSIWAKRVEAAREDDLLPHYIDREWWDDE